jgi:sorting nexin-25
MQPPSASIRLAVAVSLVSIAIPGIIRVVSSPWTLLFFSPLILLLVVICFLCLNIFVGYVLDTARPPKRSQLKNVARPFAFSTPAAWQAVITRSQWSHKSPKALAPLIPDYPSVSSTLNDILIMIVRDFVLAWYKDISTSPSFPTAVSATLHSTIYQIISRANNIDPTNLIVKKIIPRITTHIERFRQSEIALRGAALERKLTQSEELDILLAGKYASMGSGKLHPAVENLSSTFTRQTEEAHLKRLVHRILPLILPEKEVKSKTVTIVVREIVVCAVLFPIVEMFSDPDFWNKTIDEVVGVNLLVEYFLVF